MKIKNETLYKDSFCLFIMNMLASLLNYICQILMAKVLSVSSFGAINTIFSYLLIVGVPGTTLTMLVSKKIAELNFDSKSNLNYSYLLYGLKIVNILTVFAFFLLLIMSPALKGIMRLPNNLVTLEVVLLGALSFYHPFFSGVYTGIKRFIILGMYALFIPLYKLVAVWAGWKFGETDEAKLILLLAFMIIGTICVALGGFALSIKVIGRKKIKKEKRLFEKEKLDSETINTFLINICLMIYMNMDVLSIRYRGGEVESGLYSSVILFGRIIYYFATTLASILLPNVIYDNKNKKKVLNRCMAMLLIFSIVCLLPINIWGYEIIKLIYGEQYGSAQVYIIYNSVISIALSLNTVLTNYLVGIGKTRQWRNVLIIEILIILGGIGINIGIFPLLFLIGLTGLLASVFGYYLSVSASH